MNREIVSRKRLGEEKRMNTSISVTSLPLWDGLKMGKVCQNVENERGMMHFLRPYRSSRKMHLQLFIISDETWQFFHSAARKVRMPHFYFRQIRVEYSVILDAYRKFQNKAIKNDYWTDKSMLREKWRSCFFGPKNISDFFKHPDEHESIEKSHNHESRSCRKKKPKHHSLQESYILCWEDFFFHSLRRKGRLRSFRSVWIRWERR